MAADLVVLKAVLKAVPKVGQTAVQLEQPRRGPCHLVCATQTGRVEKPWRRLQCKFHSQLLQRSCQVLPCNS